MVVAVAGHDLVVAGTRRQGVVAALAHDHVVGAGAGVGVGAAGPHPVFAGDHAGEVGGAQHRLLDAHQDQLVAAGQADLGVAAVVGDHRLQRQPIADVDAVGSEVDLVLALDEVGDGVHVGAGPGLDHEGIEALAAGQRVAAQAAVQAVGTDVAGNRVVEAVAGAVDGGLAGQDQVFHMIRKGVADGAENRVRAFAGVLGHHVGGVVHHVGVVAVAAGHGVVAGAAVERVVAVPAVQRVVADAAEKGIVAVAAFQRVVAEEAVQPVGVGRCR